MLLGHADLDRWTHPHGNANDLGPRYNYPSLGFYTTTKKLSYRKTGPYELLRVNDSTVTVEQDGLQVTVSIDRVTVDPVKGSGRYFNGEEHSTSLGDNPSGDTGQENLDPEYVVKRCCIIRRADSYGSRDLSCLRILDADWPIRIPLIWHTSALRCAHPVNFIR